MRKLGSICIVLGIILLLFIVFAKGKTYLKQKKLLDEYQSQSVSLANDPMRDHLQQIKVQDGQVIGILQIPKIKLKTPIVEGVTPEDIRYAVGHFPSSSSLGNLGKKNQNFAIAGHRSYTYGQFFNRLNELDKGDTIILQVENIKFTYQVIKKKVVLPTNVDVIKPVSGKSLVTLITCHPARSDKYRLIIFSELVSEKTLAKGK